MGSTLSGPVAAVAAAARAETSSEAIEMIGRADKDVEGAEESASVAKSCMLGNSARESRGDGDDGSMSMGIEQLNAFAERIVHVLEQREEARGAVAPPAPADGAAAAAAAADSARVAAPPARPPPMIVRPISASTLIALTEPCLMAWCCDPESDFNTSGGVAGVPNSWPAAAPIQNEAGTSGDRVNLWGY